MAKAEDFNAQVNAPKCRCGQEKDWETIPGLRLCPVCDRAPLVLITALPRADGPQGDDGR